MNLLDFLYSLIFEEKVMDTEYDVVDEIKQFELSKERELMLDGVRYFLGDQDILNKKRLVIGQGGVLEEVDNLPNAQIVNNQYRKLVIQKTNYMVGKPLIITTDNDKYQEELKKIFNRKFQRKLHNLMEDCLNEGIAWLFPYITDTGELDFREFHGYEIIPIYKDESKEQLLGAIRFHDHKRNNKIERCVEVFAPNGLYKFWVDGNNLVEDSEYPFKPYFFNRDIPLDWGLVPLIPFRYNRYEQPLIAFVKSLQDAINQINSTFEDRLEEDPRQSIIVLKNYDGENLGEFRRNLAQYGAVKVSSTDGGDGDVKTLTIEVNSENYKSILKEFNKALIENGFGYDAKDDKSGQNANQMNLKSMYNDIDLDTNGIEIEFQCSMETLMKFVDTYLSLTEVGNYQDERVEFVFNRDMIMNDTDKVNMFVQSVDLSLETRLANHPWVTDTKKELDRIKKEQKELNYGYNNIGEEDISNDDESAE